MPELPDIEAYKYALERRIVGTTLTACEIKNPFLLRTVDPGVATYLNKPVCQVQRLSKRLAIGFENDSWMVIHLMIAGRLHWVDTDKKLPAKKHLMLMTFESGTLLLTEAGTKRRASLHLHANTEDMQTHDRGGLEIFDINCDQFKDRLLARNHTLKRALTDQSIFSGIGNAYSDEILNHAKLSPILQTQKMTGVQVEQLYNSCHHTLKLWTERLRLEFADSFPKKVTAFKSDMRVHGKFQQPCPECETAIQRIRYARNETNYCPRCQTGGKLLADRALSRLLKKDWPKTIEALEKGPSST